MDKDRAKEILMGIDPKEAPKEEPGVDDALGMLESDADLQNWQEEEMAFDDAVSAKLQSIEAPAGLCDQLLATVQSAKPEGGRMAGFPPVLLAAAAAAVVMGIISVMNIIGGRNEVEQSGPLTFASFQQDMAETIRTGNFSLAKRDRDFTRLQEWVNNNGGPATSSCEKLAASNCKGCTFLKWGKNKVAMFCIDVDDENLIHMFVMDRDKFSALPPESEMRTVQRHEGLPATGWADDESVYVIVGHDEKTPVTDVF